MDDATWDFHALVETHLAQDRSTRARVRRLADWVLEDPARAHDVASLAERAAVSPRTLSRLFLRETGAPPAKFVEQARVALARALLEKSCLGVESVAVRCGFGSGERMRRAFRRALGSSPRRYTSSGCGTMRR
jgi:transcriptional regulator GlxA family with amidase domain